MFPLVRMNRPEDGVVLNPPRLFADETLEPNGALGSVRPLGVDESLEGSPKGPMLEQPDVRVVDPGRAAHLVEPRPLLRRE